MESSSKSSLSLYDELELSHSPLINGLPDDIALFCLARLPRKYHAVLKCVSKRWRDLICSDEWRDYRHKHNLSESWIYALCRDKSNDQLCFYTLDPSCCTRQSYWKMAPRFPPHCLKRKGFGFVAMGKKLYLLGGCVWSEDAFDEVYCYDVSADTWSEGASMPMARCYFGCSTLDGKIYAIGGYGLKTSTRHSCDTYDSRSDTWDSHSNPSIILDIEDSIVMDGQIYVRSRASTIPPHVSMATYDPSNASWQHSTDDDMALGWQGPAVVVENNLYILDQSSGTKLTMWVKETREWVTVCRLSSLLTRPPCQMVATGKNIFIVGRGLTTVVLDVGNVSNTERVVQTYSCIIVSSKSIMSIMTEIFKVYLREKGNYTIITADSGKDALHILQKKKHEFNLVLTASDLDDMSSFQFMRKVEMKTQLPVVAMCDCYDQAAIMKALMAGAIFCLVKPLNADDIGNLWQFPMLKQRRVMVEPCQFPVMGIPEAMRREVAQESTGIQVGSIPRNEPLMREKYQKGKVDKLESVNGWSIGQSLASVSTPDVEHKLVKSVEDLGRSDSVPPLLARRLNAPGISGTVVVEEPQQFEANLRRQWELQSRMFDAEESSASSPSSPRLDSQPMDLQDNNNDECITYNDNDEEESGESAFKKYLENPHSRERLKRLVEVSLRKWCAILIPTALSDTPPLETVFPDASGVPPISAPVTLAIFLETFIHTLMALRHAPPGFWREVASKMALTGPSISSEFKGRDEKLERFLEEMDIEDIFHTIEELLG